MSISIALKILMVAIVGGNFEQRKLLSIGEKLKWLDSARGQCIENQAEFQFDFGSQCNADSVDVCYVPFRNGACKFPATESCLVDNYGKLSTACLDVLPCASSAAKYCGDVEQGQNKILQCLEGYKSNLPNKCRERFTCLKKATHENCVPIEYEDIESPPSKQTTHKRSLADDAPKDDQQRQIANLTSYLDALYGIVDDLTTLRLADNLYLQKQFKTVFEKLDRHSTLLLKISKQDELRKLGERIASQKSAKGDFVRNRDPCGDDEWQCKNGGCIWSEYFCDSYDDCSDKSDEAECGDNGDGTDADVDEPENESIVESKAESKKESEAGSDAKSDNVILMRSAEVKR